MKQCISDGASFGAVVLGNRDDFTNAVREAVEASGEKLSRTDEKNLIATALRQYDLAKGALNGGALFDAILHAATKFSMMRGLASRPLSETDVQSYDWAAAKSSLERIR